MPNHLLGLPGGTWKVWRWVGLRGAGFPAHNVLRLAAPHCSAAALNLLEAEVEVQRRQEQMVAALSLELSGAEAPLQSTLQRALRRAKKGKPPQAIKLGDDAARATAAFRQALTQQELLRANYSQIFAAATPELSQNIWEIAHTARFQEAVLWQNRRAFHTSIGLLLHKAPGSERSSKDRQHEAMVANYLQRYCVKNDTIGFFGPVGWASLVSEGQRINVQPGPQLLATRNVYFEGWGFDEIAASLARDRQVRPWLVPKLLPFARLVDTTVSLPGEKPFRLEPKLARILQECDGRRNALNLATNMLAEPTSDIQSIDEIYQALAELNDKAIISWGFGLPLGPSPDLAFREMLSGIGDDPLRRLILRLLDKLEAARQSIAAAAGDVAKLDQALSELENLFARLTGKASTRSAGKTYAARTLVYEDCRRDLELQLGPEFLGEVGPALTLLLTSARWLTFRAAALLRQQFKQIYLDLVRESGSARVSAVDFWLRSKDSLYSDDHSPLVDLVAEFQAYWADILGINDGCTRLEYTSAELRQRVMQVFNAPRPGWITARYHCPDLMIMAADEAAIRQGHYQVVLGEVHLAVNTLAANLFLAQHPTPELLLRASESDLPESRLIPVPSRRWPTLTTRTVPRFFPSNCVMLEMADDAFARDRSRALPIGNLVIELANDELIARTRDGQWQMELISSLSDVLSGLIMNCFRLRPPFRHTPRITIDRLVVCREAWHFEAAEMPFAFIKDESQRFLACWRWVRQNQLPRFVFSKTLAELKPYYVDFESPLLVNNFAKTIRQMAELKKGGASLVLTEMLPGFDHLWLPDAEGQRYTSELRMVAVDTAS